jgi:peptide/nickel transport system substrate-binding protein
VGSDGWNTVRTLAEHRTMRRALFTDERVRRALTMAIDRQGIIDGIFYGHGDVANSMVPPFLWAHDPDAGADLRYSPEAARRLLAEAGWEDREGNGVLEDGAGREFRLALLSAPGSADAVEKIMSDLRRVGVVVEPRMVELNAMVAIIMNTARDFDAILTAFATSPFPDVRATLFHCRNRDTGFQWSGICDVELDRLIDTIPEVINRDAAMPLWSAYQRRLAELQPYTFLYHPHSVRGVSNRLRNVHPDPRSTYAGLDRWWLVPDGRGAAGAGR